MVPAVRQLERPLRWALLAGTAVLYLVGLDRSGWGNTFYAAAAQAGSQSWTALFFGSSDAGNSITVDKPPASLWLMGISARLFGLSSWSVLVPQALLGVAAVALLMAAVRRALGPWAGLLAGLLLGADPGGHADVPVRQPRRPPDPAGRRGGVHDDARDRGRPAPLGGRDRGAAGHGLPRQVAAGVPGAAGDGAVLLVAAPGPLRRRLVRLAAGGAALAVSAGWWLLAVAAIPAADRPWVGGSTTDSPLDLALGYNGLGRLAGERSPSGRVAVHGGSVWRLFGSGGDQVGWLLPAAAVGLAAGLWLVRGRPRTDPVRAALLLWGGWAVVTALVLSTMQGISHAYYAVELAPALAALVAIGATLLWRRGTMRARLLLAATSVLTTVWGMSLVERRLPAGSAVEIVLVATGLLATGGLLVLALAETPVLRSPMVRRTVAGATIAAALVGPSAWSVATAALPHHGASVWPARSAVR